MSQILNVRYLRSHCLNLLEINTQPRFIEVIITCKYEKGSDKKKCFDAQWHITP